MKQFTAGLVLSVCLSLLFSCQKEVSSESNTGGGNGGGGSNTGPDTSFIYKIVEIDSSTRDSSVLYFDYDNLKRVTLIRNWEQGFPVDTAYGFYYTGSQALPYKTTDFWHFTETYHFYNAQNKLTGDSLNYTHDTGHIIYNTRDYHTYEYTYAPGKIIIKTIDHWYEPSNHTNGIITTLDTSMIDVNGNILFSRLNFYPETSSLTYANKLNPLAKLNIFASLRPYDYYEGDEFIHSPNLWTSVYQTTNQGAGAFNIDSKQFNIIYNADSYPVASTISLRHGSGPLDYWTRYYYYKKL